MAPKGKNVQLPINSPKSAVQPILDRVDEVLRSKEALDWEHLDSATIKITDSKLSVRFKVSRYIDVEL